MAHVAEGFEGCWVYFISRRLLKDIKTARPLVQRAGKLLVQDHLQPHALLFVSSNAGMSTCEDHNVKGRKET